MCNNFINADETEAGVLPGIRHPVADAIGRNHYGQRHYSR